MSTDRAIVTAVSSNMWHDYLVFYDSIRRHHDYHIYIVGIELTNWQINALKEHINITVLPLSPDIVAVYKASAVHWCQWYKPYYYDMIPDGHRTLLWLDVDIVILGSVDPIFEIAERRFVVMADYFAPKTCLNSPELYKKFQIDVPKEKSHIALNSGVVGFQPERDRRILKLWKRKSGLALSDKEVQSWIALFDQGCLLWALHELELTNLITPKKAWNHPAKKNPYELVSDSTKSGTMVPMWSVGNNIYSSDDLIANIRTDNPGAVVAHFAGLPKLTHLCDVNNQNSITYVRHRHGVREVRRTFIVGLERAGIQNMTNILRQSCSAECWVRHGLKPTMAAEAQALHHQTEYQTHEFLERLETYARKDCGFVCEGNKNLTYFINDIQKQLDGTARFIVMLRDPASLIRSRFLNFVTWPDQLYKTPRYYQTEYREYMQLGRDTSNNYYRLKPHDNQDRDLIDLHIWEVEHQLKTLARTFNDMSPNLYKYVWVEDIRSEIPYLSQFSGGTYIDPDTADKVARQKHGVGLKLCSQETLEWVESQIENKLAEIYQRISAFVTIPFRGI